MSSISDRTTAVVLDPHPLWLDAVGQILRGLGVSAVHAASTREVALELVEQHQPDLVIVESDLSPPEPDGIAWLREARARAPRTKAIVMSRVDDRERVEAAFEAGAETFVVKTASADDLASAIRQTLKHSIFFGAADTPAPASRPGAEPPDEPLTRREREILALVAKGHSNVQVARMLWVTEQTVKFHLSNVYRKLGVANRTEASRWARVHGLLDASSGQGVSHETRPR